MPYSQDNESGCVVHEPNLEAGHWYLEEGDLYIVPEHGEIEGPEGQVLDALTAAYRAQQFGNVDRAALAERLGLALVHEWQQRFSEAVGYYAV